MIHAKKKKLLLKVEELFRNDELDIYTKEKDYIKILSFLKNELIDKLQKYFPNEVRNSNNYIYIGINNIPIKKLKKAMKSYAAIKENEGEKIIALIDCGLILNGKKGFVFTNKGIYYRQVGSRTKWHLYYSDINDAKIVHIDYVYFAYLIINDIYNYKYKIYTTTFIKLLVFFFIENITGNKNTLYKLQQLDGQADYID